MNIKIKKFGSTLTSRQAGKEAFAAFRPSLEGIPESDDVFVDFEDVITFSPSWGGEFLTPLIQRFGQRLKLLKTQNPSVNTSLEILEESNGTKFNVI